VVLSGLNDEAHIDENLGTAGEALPNSLTPGERALVKRAAARYRELMKVGCSGCGYCMPCPAGVNIPACFEVFNKVHLFGDLEGSKDSYVMRMSGVLQRSGSGFASQCVECGKCLGKCPQGLNIPLILKDVAAELEGPDLEERVLEMARRRNIII